MFQKTKHSEGGEDTGRLGQMLTPQQVARALNVDIATLRRWANAGAGPPFVLLRHDPNGRPLRRYPENEVLAWMAALDRNLEGRAS